MSDIINIVIPIAKNILLALAVLIVGMKLINFVTKKIRKHMVKTNLDDTLKPFVSTVVCVALRIMLIASVVNILGIDTSSLIALIASTGLAIGLAFQGSLSNFAGGILLLLVRPIRVGDYIEADGNSGSVQAIQILYTELVTIDNRVVFVPNGKLANTSITNYTLKDTRRLEFKFGVGYETDSGQVKQVLREIVEAHENILQEPEPFVRMLEHGDSAVIYVVRAWAKKEVFWDTHYDIIESVKIRFDEEGISIPFPQMDVHMDK